MIPSPFAFVTEEFSALFFDGALKQGFFSVSISFLYKICWILKVLNLKKYGLTLIYSIVLMGTDKMTGQKVWGKSIPHFFCAVQTDLESDLSQELQKTFWAH